MVAALLLCRRGFPCPCILCCCRRAFYSDTPMGYASKFVSETLPARLSYVAWERDLNAGPVADDACSRRLLPRGVSCPHRSCL